MKFLSFTIKPQIGMATSRGYCTFGRQDDKNSLFPNIYWDKKLLLLIVNVLLYIVVKHDSVNIIDRKYYIKHLFSLTKNNVLKIKPPKYCGYICKTHSSYQAAGL